MERFRADHDDLFRGIDSLQLAHIQAKKMTDAVARLDDDYVLNVSEEGYINYLIEEYSLCVPLVHFEEAHIDMRKVLVDPEYLPRRWWADKAIALNMIRYTIPIEGDSSILNCRPTAWLSSGSGHFHLSSDGSNTIYTDILVIEDNSEEIKKQYDDRKDSFVKTLGFLESNIKSYNDSLPKTARRIFTNRKERIKQDNSLLASLGVPTSKQAGVPRTYSVPTVSHRFPRPELTQGVKAVDLLTPVMDNQRYAQILDAIHTIGKSYESHPNVTKDRDEETLRDLFLTQIQTSFKSDSATGESFNKSGKTDIMVKHGDGILFIAECKIWRGKKMLFEAISQLLGYLTWRDTKTALLVFVRDTSMTTVISGVQESIVSHPNYKSTECVKDETWFDYKFSMLNDPERDVFLSVQLFDFSTNHGR